MPNSLENKAAANSSSVSPATKFYGISLRLSLVILLTAIVLSFVISIGDQSVSTWVLIINILAALLVSVITLPRNLFIVVASIPICMVTSLIAVGWLTTNSAGNSGFGLAQLATAIYPVTQYFPQLFFTTLGCIAIAFARIYLLRRRQQLQSKAMLKQRSHMQVQQMRNQRASVKSRRQASNAANQLTVQELLERRKKQGDRTRSRQRTTAAERPRRQDGGARTYARRSSEESSQSRQGHSATTATKQSRPSESHRKAPNTQSYSQQTTRSSSAAPRERSYPRTQRIAATDRKNPAHGQIPRPNRSTDSAQRDSE